MNELMRFVFLLLLAAVAALPVDPAMGQTATGHASAHARSSRAARLDQLASITNSGDAAALVRALEHERDPAVRTLIRARLGAMRLDPRVANDRRLLRLAETGAPDTRAAAAAIVGELAFARGRYGEASRYTRELEALQRRAGKAHAAREAGMTRRIADLLSSQPGQTIEGGAVAGSSPAHRDAAGLMRVDLRVNGQSQEAVFDTGANLSVLSASAARRLGVRIIGGDASVGNSVSGTVTVRLALADRLEIGGNVVRNAAFLIIDDGALSFGDGHYTIPAIIGFPVMRALGRMRVEPTRFSVEPASPPIAASPNLCAVGNELFVDARVGGFAAPLYLDSGANLSGLSAAFAALHAPLFTGLAREERRLAGAGGTSSDQAVRWRNVPIEIAARRTILDSILVAAPGDVRGEDDEAARYGVVGADLLARFASYTLDLRAMRLELGEPVPAAP